MDTNRTRPPVRPNPGRPADIEATVSYMPTSAGGRSTACRSGYRPIHNFGRPGFLHVAHHHYPDQHEVPPGTSARTLLWLLTPDLLHGRLAPGAKFTVQEGQRVVGTGVVTRLPNTDLLAPAETP